MHSHASFRRPDIYTCALDICINVWKAKNIARDHESGYGPREFGLERWTRLLIRKLAAYVPAASSSLSLSRTETRPTFPSALLPPRSRPVRRSPSSKRRPYLRLGFCPTAVAWQHAMARFRARPTCDRRFPADTVRSTRTRRIPFQETRTRLITPASRPDPIL